MKQLFIVVLFLCLSSSLKAQHPGFSRTYKYGNDTLKRSESVSALAFDSAGQFLFFCGNGVLLDSGTSYAVFYKTDMHGDILTQTVDSLLQGNIGYNCVAESEDGQYLYWGGNSYAQGDTSSLSWKVRKTDKNLNLVWEQLYPASSLSNKISNIKCLDSGQLMLLCFDYTLANSLGKPVKPSTMFMRRIDSTGNIMADYHPVSWVNTDAYGLERTSDGGFMINGSKDERGYVIKTDKDGVLQWQQLFGTSDKPVRFYGMDKRPAIDTFFHAGQLIIDSHSYPLASATDEWGIESWRQTEGISWNDTFFSLTHDQAAHIILAGASFGVFDIDVTLPINTGCLAKLNQDGSTVLWSKTYRTNYGQWFGNELYKVVSLPDGGFVAGGIAQIPTNMTSNMFYPKSWLMRVDSNGCYNAECKDSTFLSSSNVIITKKEITLFPSPSSGPLHLIKTTPFPAGTTVTLSDMSGKILRTLESPAGKTQQVYQLRGSLLPGMYLLDIRMGKQSVQKKWLLLP